MQAATVLTNPVFWGSVTALVSIIPILGSALVWLPGTIVLAVDQRIGAAIGLLLVGVVVCSNIDNVIRPIVFRRVSGLHPMLSLVGAFAGMQLFGFIGIVLGPLAFAYALELLRLYEMEYGTQSTPVIPSERSQSRNQPELDSSTRFARSE